MLLTWATAALGLIGFGCQIAAHILMWDDGTPERAPTARYAVGLFIIGVCFSTGLALDARQDAIAAFWYNALLSGAATGACYYVRQRWGKHTIPFPASLEKWADAIAGEHDEA